MATQEIDPKRFQTAVVIQSDTQHKLLHREEQEQPSSILISSTSLSDEDEKSTCGDLANNDSNYSFIDVTPPAQAQPTVIKREEIINIPGAIARIKTIDADKKVAMEELASGDLCISRVYRDDGIVCFLAQVSDELQWPLSKDQRVAKRGNSLYVFSVRVPTSTKDQTSEDLSSSDEEEDHKYVKSSDSCSEHEVTSIHGGGDESEEIFFCDLADVIKRQEEYLLMELDEILKAYFNFSVENVQEKADEDKESEEEEGEEEEGNTPVDPLEGGAVAAAAPNGTGKSKPRRSSSGDSSKHYKNHFMARQIARFSEGIADRIQRSAEKTESRLKRVEELMMKRSKPQSKVTQTTRTRMKRIKNMTRWTEKAVDGTLTRMIRASDFVTNTIEESKASTLLDKVPGGLIIKASVRGSNDVTHAAGEAGKRITSRSTDLATRLVFNRQEGQSILEAGKYPTSAESSKSGVCREFI